VVEARNLNGNLTKEARAKKVEQFAETLENLRLIAVFFKDLAKAKQ
jgi:hypothetical protein